MQDTYHFVCDILTGLSYVVSRWPIVKHGSTELGFTATINFFTISARLTVSKLLRLTRQKQKLYKIHKPQNDTIHFGVAALEQSQFNCTRQ